MSEKTQAFEKIFNEEKEKWKKFHPTAAHILEDELRQWMCRTPTYKFATDVWENTLQHLMRKAEKRGEYVDETIKIAFSQDTITDIMKILR